MASAQQNGRDGSVSGPSVPAEGAVQERAEGAVQEREGQTPTSADGPATEGPTVADLEDRWRRAAADLHNLRKRYDRDLARERDAERDRVAAAFLPVLDNIDLALRHAEADPAAIVAGVRAVREQALALLAALGYPRQDEAGMPFDPAQHQVVGVVAPEEAGVPPGAVATVVRPGYGPPERQLRPASVTVSRAPGS